MVTFKSYYLLGIVCYQPHFFNAKVHKYLGAYAVISQIRLEPELQIGLNRIESLVLQFISLELARKSDASAFLSHIEYYALTFPADHFHRAVQLITAVAAPRSE